MKYAISIVALALAMSSPVSNTAYALTVFDPANHQQNVLSALRALETINNQIKQLQNEARLLGQMDQNLKAIGTSVSPELQATLQKIARQIADGKAIALRVEETTAAFERLFPGEVEAATLSDAALRDAQLRWQEAHASFKRSALLQGEIAGAVEIDTRLLEDLMSRSRDAAGALEATQTGNELTALNVKQTLQLQSLLAAHHRAESMDRARGLVAQEEGRQRFRSFLGDGQAYNPDR